MNKLPYFIAGILLFIIFFSCQKELDCGSNITSKGFLVKNSSSNCTRINVAGIFKTAKVLIDSNHLDVTVHVTTIGAYIIGTDTVNGYSFKATGHFSNTGDQQVRLAGAGKPAVTGTNQFTVFYDTSLCQFSVVVLPGTPSAPPAAFTLAGTPNGCTNAALSGVFAQGGALDTSSAVTITLNVTVPGSYNIFTNTVNGYHFSGSGILTATGIQTVKLYASGTPIGIGSNIFTITANAANCNFSVPVITSVPVNSTDYFPLTTRSFWVYDDLYNVGDTIKRTIVDSVIKNGNLYKIMQQDRPFNTQQFLFRRGGDDYLEYGKTEKYTNSFSYSTAMENDLLFLKANLANGTFWQSPIYSGIASFGQLIYLRYKFCV